MGVVGVSQIWIGVAVHVPHCVFPDEEEPPLGFWEGKTVATRLGGKGDIVIKIIGESVFTRPMVEVAGWVAMD